MQKNVALESRQFQIKCAVHAYVWHVLELYCGQKHVMFIKVYQLSSLMSIDDDDEILTDLKKRFEFYKCKF